MLKQKTFKKFIKENKKIEEIIYKEQYTLFFEYKKNLFASVEDDRLIFAKIKNKDKDIDWKQAKFLAYDLEAKLKGEERAKYFSIKEIKKIKILQSDEIVRKLKNGK